MQEKSKSKRNENPAIKHHYSDRLLEKPLSKVKNNRQLTKSRNQTGLTRIQQSHLA